MDLPVSLRYIVEVMLDVVQGNLTVNSVWATMHTEQNRALKTAGMFLLYSNAVCKRFVVFLVNARGGFLRNHVQYKKKKASQEYGLLASMYALFRL